MSFAPPTIVQSAIATGISASPAVTLPAPPIEGNMLVAGFLTNLLGVDVNAGWNWSGGGIGGETKLWAGQGELSPIYGTATNTVGQGALAKRAGSSESATQFPMQLANSQGSSTALAWSAIVVEIANVAPGTSPLSLVLAELVVALEGEVIPIPVGCVSAWDTGVDLTTSYLVLAFGAQQSPTSMTTYNPDWTVLASQDFYLDTMVWRPSLAEQYPATAPLDTPNTAYLVAATANFASFSTSDVFYVNYDFSSEAAFAEPPTVVPPVATPTIGNGRSAAGAIGNGGFAIAAGDAIGNAASQAGAIGNGDDARS